MWIITTLLKMNKLLSMMIVASNKYTTNKLNVDNNNITENEY